MKISELPLAPSVSSTDDVPIDRSGVTYRVHYEALRGNGIASIAKTGTSGLVDTYTMTFTDGSTFTYTVTNGATGSGAWGTITGTLSNQTDLQNALNAKANTSDTYTKTQVDTALSGKLGTDFSALTALPQAPAASDLMAIRSGSDTYKIDYNALADAIVARLTPDYANAASAVAVTSGTTIYTATSRCLLYLDFTAASRTVRTIYVNGKRVFMDGTHGGGSGTNFVNPMVIPLAAGDVVTSSDAFTSSSTLNYVVVPYKA